MLVLSCSSSTIFGRFAGRSLSSWCAESRGVILLGAGTYGRPSTRRSVLASSVVSTATRALDAVCCSFLGSLLSSGRGSWHWLHFVCRLQLLLSHRGHRWA